MPNKITLSPAQLNVVNLRNCDLQVIACAGSGKTESISQRVAKLIEEGVEPTSIIAFTFTEKAAAELKERITARVADVKGIEYLDRLGSMFVGTIHGWCFRMLQDHVPHYGNFDVLDEHRHAAFLAREYSGIGLDKLTNTKMWEGIGLWKDTADAIGNELLRSEKLKGIIKNISTTYDEKLEHFRLLTFSRIISQAVQELKNPTTAKRVIEPLRHLVVDEYQDINPAQETLIELLAQPHVQLCVVGDDDQSIYQWRGSDVENIQGFVKRRKALGRNVKTVNLDENRRSRPAIVTAAVKFGKTIKPRLSKEMVPTRKETGNSICLWLAETPEDEAETVAESIVRLHQKGYAYGDIAILFRSVKTSSQPFIIELKKRNIPVTSGGRSGLFSHPESHAFARIYAWFAEWGWKEKQFGGLEQTVDLEGLANELSKLFPDGGGPKKIRQYLSDWKKQISKPKFKVNLVGDFYRLLRQMGVHKWDLGHPELAARMGMFGRFSAILADYESIHCRANKAGDTFRSGRISDKSFYRNLINYLMHYARDNYEDFEGESILDVDAVQIMTVHQAKGLEWPIVFVPALKSDRFPSRNTGKKKDWLLDEKIFPQAKRQRYEGSDADERRLFYVALTRAKDCSYVSTFERIKNKAKPSPYLADLGLGAAKIMTSLPLPQMEKQGQKEPPKLSISFSEIAKWEDCGLRFRFSNSLGLLPPMAEELGYGKAVHHILRLVAEEALAKKDVPKWAKCERIVQEEFFTPYADKSSFGRMRKSALEMLRTYYERHKNDLERIWATERPFELHTEMGVVTGRADVILDRENGAIQKMAIVDYKVSKNEALKERYEQQLRIYTAVGRGEGIDVEAAYLHELRESQRLTVDVTIEKTKQAVEKIKGVMGQIKQGAYPANPDKVRCEGCDYNHVCKECEPSVKRKLGI
jgi:DNA helicase II / ATP-dependent DNA helicase PcrA